MRFKSINRRVFRVGVMCFLLLCMAGCSEENLPYISRLHQTYVVQDDFQDTLKAEYKNLAAFEEDERHDAPAAEHYMAKARDASWGKKVAPDTLEMYPDIPKKYHRKINEARDMLLDAIDTMFIPENEGLLAIAQTKYDCWFHYRNELKNRPANLACEEDFYNALRNLQMPGAYSGVFNVYFGSNETQLSGEGFETVREVAEIYGNRSHWTIILTGHTDSVGNRTKNKTLSLRRAVAVKNALAQYGVDFDNIAISADGEERVAGEGDADNAESRRVSIAFKPGFVTDSVIRDISEYEGWRHIGGN